MPENQQTRDLRNRVNRGKNHPFIMKMVHILPQIKYKQKVKGYGIKNQKWLKYNRVRKTSPLFPKREPVN